MKEWPWYWVKKEENRETKDGFLRQISPFFWFCLQAAPCEHVWASEKTYLELKLKVTSGLRTIFPNEITVLLFLIPPAQIPQGIKLLDIAV